MKSNDKLKLVVAENITFSPENYTTGYYANKEVDEEDIFTDFHRYNGNHVLGHGVSVAKVYKVSREKDEILEKEIERQKKILENTNKRLRELYERFNIPYTEEFEKEIRIGQLPTKEFLIGQGHYSKEEIEEAFSKLKIKSND